MELNIFLTLQIKINLSDYTKHMQLLREQLDRKDNDNRANDTVDTERSHARSYLYAYEGLIVSESCCGLNEQGIKNMEPLQLIVGVY